MKFSIYQDTHVGGRSLNQDRMGYSFTSDALLMIVADGMGGHLRGEVAAQIALQVTATCFQQAARPGLVDPAGFLDDALRRAHREILRYQSAQGLPESPRTTVVACIVQGGRAWWAHAGDSRLYWLRGDRCLTRTRDHSKVQSLINLGLLDPSEQETHPERNKVLNCLGSPFEPTIELGGAPELNPGDTLMLCSDGVWSAFSDAEFCGMFYGTPVRQAVPRVVSRAVMQLGAAADNATALAMNWAGESAGGAEVSSEAVPEGAITTTIAVGPLDEGEGAERMSEDEIERTIREIRAAIDRSGSGT